MNQPSPVQNRVKKLANKIHILLLKENKESKTSTDLADSVKLEILNLDKVFWQQIGILSQEEEIKVLEYTTELAELLRDKGTDLISQLRNQDEFRMVRSEGRSSFVVRHLYEGWERYHLDMSLTMM